MRGVVTPEDVWRGVAQGWWEAGAAVRGEGSAPRTPGAAALLRARMPRTVHRGLGKVSSSVTWAAARPAALAGIGHVRSTPPRPRSRAHCPALEKWQKKSPPGGLHKLLKGVQERVKWKRRGVRVRRAGEDGDPRVSARAGWISPGVSGEQPARRTEPRCSGGGVVPFPCTVLRRLSFRLPGNRGGPWE